MDITFLTNYLNSLIFGICLLLGYCIKTAIPKIPNRFIPLSALILGAALSVITYQSITLEVILGGMFSGLASTGCYEMIRNLINKEIDPDTYGLDDGGESEVE